MVIGATKIDIFLAAGSEKSKKELDSIFEVLLEHETWVVVTHHLVKIKQICSKFWLQAFEESFFTWLFRMNIFVHLITQLKYADS